MQLNVHSGTCKRGTRARQAHSSSTDAIFVAADVRMERMTGAAVFIKAEATAKDDSTIIFEIIILSTATWS